MEQKIKYIKKILLKKGASDVVLSNNKQSATQIKFSNNKISVTKCWNASSLEIFIAMGKKIAVTSIKKFDNKTIDLTVKNLINLAKLSQKNNDYRCIAKGPFKYDKIKELYDKKIFNVDKANIVEKAINEALSNGAKRVSGVLECSEGEVHLTSSSNVDVKGKGSIIHISLRALASKEASGHITHTSRVLDKFDFLEVGREAGRIAKESKHPKMGKSGNYDVIFSPLAFANLLALVGEASSIFSVESGFSFLRNKLGRKVGSDLVNFYDNPVLANGVGSTSFDAEGYPTKKKSIIEDGFLKTYLHNASSAKRYKVRNTGNAGLISPAPLNLVLKKGGLSRDMLVKDVKNGLLITNLWYTRFKNYDTGEFSTIPRDGAFFIKNGEIKHAVKGIRISESLLNILGNVKGLGKDSKQIVGWETEIPTTTPSVLVKDVNVSKPG